MSPVGVDKPIHERKARKNSRKIWYGIAGGDAFPYGVVQSAGVGQDLLFGDMEHLLKVFHAVEHRASKKAFILGVRS